MQSTSPSTRVRRLGALVGPALVGAFVLASCGGGETGATQSTLDLSSGSTAFVVRTPATTEPPVDSAAVSAEGTVTGTQDYTVQPGDYPYLLVNRFGIKLAELISVNEWASEKSFPGPGTVILLPPGAKSIDAVAAGTAAGGATTGDATTGSAAPGDVAAATTTTVAIPAAGDNCAPGSYTIVAGDIPIKVAKKFDVTVDALNSANSSTSGYGAFYVGLVIVIPAKANC